MQATDGDGIYFSAAIEEAPMNWPVSRNYRRINVKCADTTADLIESFTDLTDDELIWNLSENLFQNLVRQVQKVPLKKRKETKLKFTEGDDCLRK
jgi:hypothetical protein